MTRKHFQAIAEILKDTNAPIETVERLSAYFSTVNGNFKPERFKEAAQ